jgi:tellurite resistance protein TehA-like permease
MPLRFFSTNWFVIPMGWGGVVDVAANVWGRDGFITGWINAAVWVNTAIFTLFITLWIVRWLMEPRQMWRELTHPASSHFFALIPIAMTVMGMNWSVMGNEFPQALIWPIINSLWTASVATGLAFSLIITEAMMRQEKSSSSYVSFAWLIGSVANALFPLLGHILVVREFKTLPAWSRFVNIADIAYFGTGFFLFLFITAFLFTTQTPRVNICQMAI